MSRAHLNRPIVDSEGKLVVDATVRVLQPGTTTPITDTLYQNRTGSTVRTQPWAVDTGLINFYLNAAQTVRLGITRTDQAEVFVEDIDVSGVVDLYTSVKDFGALGDGVTDDAPAIQAAINAMTAKSTLFFPDGVYIVGATIILPNVDGASLIGPAPAPVNRLGAAVIQAKAGSSLPAILASKEWYDNGLAGGAKDAQGIGISNLTLHGGGFLPESNHDTEIETTANTQFGLVIHGSAFKIKDVFINSANSHGLVVAGSKGRNGSTDISESHEGWIRDCGIRYVGGDGFHAMPGAQDCFMSTTKVQYAGGHGFFLDDQCAAWQLDNNHPSRCGRDMFHCESGWECGLQNNYIDALGDFMDGVDIPGRDAGDIRYGIFMNTGDGQVAHIDHNRMHTESSGGQSDPVVGLYLKGWVIATYNTLISHAGDSSVTMLVDDGTTAWSEVVGNHEHIAT